jgi:hypothetical protein
MTAKVWFQRPPFIREMSNEALCPILSPRQQKESTKGSETWFSRKRNNANEWYLGEMAR